MDPIQVAAYQSLANMANGVIKMGHELKKRLEAAPKSIDGAEVEKAAAALVNGKWIEAHQKDQALSILSDPNEALKVLTDLATKAAAAVGNAQNGDPRLDNGKPVPSPANPMAAVKMASERGVTGEVERIGGRVANNGDEAFMQRMLGYRQHLAQN